MRFVGFVVSIFHRIQLSTSRPPGIYDEARRSWLFPDKNNEEASKAFIKQGNEIFKWDDWNEIRILRSANRGIYLRVIIVSEDIAK